ncbi:MAG: aldo/keto reductase [Verrucomicrobiota bacterium]
MEYARCGRWGLKLPPLSLGLWHNFGDVDDFGEGSRMARAAFEAGVTHFDLANNYGPPPGSAEANFGKILKGELAGKRDEMVVSTKAGHGMWEGPYGDWGSRKHLVASMDQSLGRMGLEYVDIFYSHRWDPETPLEETMGALADFVHQGKAIYVGISKYPLEEAKQAVGLLDEMGVPCVIYQGRYSMLYRGVEGDGILDWLIDEGIGFTGFSPLAQGLLTGKYLAGIEAGSRAERAEGFLQEGEVRGMNEKVAVLGKIAEEAGYSLHELALRWAMDQPGVTSLVIGARTVAQLAGSLAVLEKGPLSAEVRAAIDGVCPAVSSASEGTG